MSNSDNLNSPSSRVPYADPLVEQQAVKVKTPCIGVCSTGIGGEVCRGCKRFIHEIAGWNGYDNTAKSHVINRISVLLVQVVQSRISIRDVSKLEAGLKAYDIRYQPSADPHAWVLDLLKAGASQLDSLSAFGCEIKSSSKKLSLPELRDVIDEDFYTLSEAHYERYFDTK